MKVAVIGPTGFTGSHVCVELINRGHEVTGLSRNPEKLGKHSNYHPVKLDASTASIAEIVDTLQGFDALVNAFNGPNNYKSFVETTRKIILAAKAVKIGYFIMIGGTGSLHLPGDPHSTAADSRTFWLSYRRAVADSECATSHTQDRVGPGPISDSVRAYRNARLAVRSGSDGVDERKLIKDVEDQVLYGENWIPDLPLAARATFLMFEDNETFKWSFVSPSARFRPGPRTGVYSVFIDELPLRKEPEKGSESVDGNEFDGRLLGVSAADLAVAIVDEVEKRDKVGKHWSAVSEWEGDEAYPTTVTI